MPAPTGQSIFGAWPPTPEDTPPKDKTPGGTNLDGIPCWLDAPELYDRCELAGQVLPGLAQVTCETGRKLDIKQAKGVDGATITDNGSEPETVEIILTMWRRDQWVVFQQMVPLINPSDVKGKIKPVDIVHPVVNLFNVRRIYINKVNPPTPSRIKGAFEVKIQAKGWRPEPKNTTSKSKTDKSSESGGGTGQFMQEDTNGVKHIVGLGNLLPSSSPPK